MAGRSVDELVALDDAALARVVGGYSPEMFAQMQKAVSQGMTINSTWTGDHGSSPAGWAHYNGHAFDSIASDDKMWSYFHQAMTAKPHEMIFHNQHFINGTKVAPMGGHDTHVHTGY